jgi:hypothetical protein
VASRRGSVLGGVLSGAATAAFALALASLLAPQPAGNRPPEAPATSVSGVMAGASEPVAPAGPASDTAPATAEVGGVPDASLRAPGGIIDTRPLARPAAASAPGAPQAPGGESGPALDLRPDAPAPASPPLPVPLRPGATDVRVGVTPDHSAGPEAGPDTVPAETRAASEELLLPRAEGDAPLDLRAALSGKGQVWTSRFGAPVAGQDVGPDGSAQ